jgi:WD40 repeat protein
MVKRITYSFYPHFSRQQISASPPRSQLDSPKSSQKTFQKTPQSTRFRNALLIITALFLAGLVPISWIILQTAALKQQAKASQEQLQTDAAAGLATAIQTTGQNRSLLPWNILPDVQANLLNAVQTARETNRITLEAPVTAVNFSPDARSLAAADAAGDIHLWNRQGQAQQTLEGDGQPISAINFSPDGAALVGNSAETLGNAQFWRLNDSSDYQAPAQADPTAVAFSTDGQLLISGNGEGWVRLWDRSGGAVARLYPQQLGSITSVGLDGPALVSGDETGRISLWSNQGTALGQLWAGARIRSLRLDQNGQRIISQDANRQQAFLWDSQRQTWNQFLLGQTQTVRAADLSSDQQIVANGKTDGHLTLRPLDSQNRRILPQSFAGHSGAIDAVAFSPDNRTLLTGGEDGTIRLWDVQDGILISRYALQEWSAAPLGSMALSPDGQQIALSSGSRLSRGSARQQSRVQTVDPFQNSRLSFRPDGQELIAQTTSRDGTISFSLQNQDGQETARFSIKPDAPQQIAFSPTGLVSLSQQGTLQLWNRQGQAIATAQAPAATQFLVFSPDGQRLVSSGQQAQQTCLWAIQGNQIRQQSCLAVASRTVAFSRDGKQVALGFADGTVGLWNQHDALTTWQANQSAVVALAFSADGQTIASGSADGQIRLSMQGKAIGQPFAGHQAALQSLAFNEADHSLVSLGSDGEVRIWQANWRAWLKTACQRLANHPILTQAETPAGRSAQAICAGVGTVNSAPDRASYSDRAGYSAAPPPAVAETRLVVKLSERKVYLYRGSQQGEQLQATYPIAVGKAGWETPTGRFRVFRMLEQPGWTNPLTGATISRGSSTPLGSRWIAFWSDGVDQIGFHATSDRASVGKAASHGCLRMYDEDAKALYEQVKLGTWVTVQP